MATARVLREHGISSVPVRGVDGPAGILAERDDVRVAADGRDQTKVTVGARMSRNVVTVGPKTDITEDAA